MLFMCVITVHPSCWLLYLFGLEREVKLIKAYSHARLKRNSFYVCYLLLLGIFQCPNNSSRCSSSTGVKFGSFVKQSRANRVPQAEGICDDRSRTVIFQNMQKKGSKVAKSISRELNEHLIQHDKFPDNTDNRCLKNIFMMTFRRFFNMLSRLSLSPSPYNTYTTYTHI